MSVLNQPMRNTVKFWMCIAVGMTLIVAIHGNPLSGKCKDWRGFSVESGRIFEPKLYPCEQCRCLYGLTTGCARLTCAQTSSCNDVNRFEGSCCTGKNKCMDSIPNGSTDKDNVKYIGCYNDKIERAMKGSAKKDYKNLTTEICIKRCQDAGFKYAATQYGHECFCGNSYSKYGIARETECAVQCNGNTKQICGGIWTMSVYQARAFTLLYKKCRDWSGYAIENGMQYQPTEDHCQQYVCENGIGLRCPAGVCTLPFDCENKQTTDDQDDAQNDTVKVTVGVTAATLILVIVLLAFIAYKARQRRALLTARCQSRQQHEDRNPISVIPETVVGVADPPPPYSSLTSYLRQPEEPPAYESLGKGYNLQLQNSSNSSNI